VALLALIAGTVSYLHMHMLVARHGQPGWVAALTPLSVDGMIVAASTTLLADLRSGRNGGALPWALLVAGSVASLAAAATIDVQTASREMCRKFPLFIPNGRWFSPRARGGGRADAARPRRASACEPSLGGRLAVGEL
jgi:hypothetical protein